MQADMPGTLVDLQERLRAANEQLTLNRLKADRKALRLQQIATSMRWWVVADLCWMMLEALEPARFAWSYPGSWAYKLAVAFSDRYLVVGWFGVAAACVLPLILAMATVPKSRFCRRCERLAFIGLLMGGIGFAFMASSAARLDIPQVVDSYRWSTLKLISTGLLVACWHNSRLVLAHNDALMQSAGGRAPCVDSPR